MTIYVVMQHALGRPDVPVSAWDSMISATLDMIDRESQDAYEADTTTTTYTVVPVNLGGDK